MGGEVNKESVSYKKLISKAKKLKALAERGVVNERESAQNFYNEFIEKHDIREEEIDPKHHNRTFKLRSKDYSVLLSHIIMSVNPYIKIDKKRGEYNVILDDEDYVEVVERVDFFYQAFNKEKELLLLAFMEKFSVSFMADEQAVDKHFEVAMKMQEEAEKLFRKKNPNNSKLKMESNPLDRISDEVLSAKKSEPVVLKGRDAEKYQVLKKWIDDVKYTKANRRIGSGKK